MVDVFFDLNIGKKRGCSTNLQPLTTKKTLTLKYLNLFIRNKFY